MKLKAIGVGGKVIEWIKDWLSERKQRVVIEDNYSDWADVVSSVIQGSVLGGTFFNVFIDDIDDSVLGALLRKFADDTKLAMVIGSIEDAQRMQDNLDRICEWADRWRMSFNVKKC